VLIQVDKEDCVWLKEASWYNNNYYKLPFKVNGCRFLYEEYDGAEEFCGNVIGEFIEDEFVPVWYLHQIDYSEYFQIDSETMKDKNEWT